MGFSLRAGLGRALDALRDLREHEPVDVFCQNPVCRARLEHGASVIGVLGAAYCSRTDDTPGCYLEGISMAADLDVATYPLILQSLEHVNGPTLQRMIRKGTVTQYERDQILG